MTILAAALAVAVFAVAMKLSGLYPAVLDAARIVIRASNVIADSTLDDLEKEKLVQRHALLLLGRSLLITLRAAAVFGSPVLLLAAMHWLGLAKFQDVTCATARMGGHCRHHGRIPGRVGGLVVSTLGPGPGPTTVSRQNSHSRLDRVLHRLAFSTIELQKALADLEDRVYASRFSQIEVDRPVFITSLPRAGTTLLLEIVASLDAFTSHTYRDMPFLITPMLWDSISRPFQRHGRRTGARRWDDRRLRQPRGLRGAAVAVLLAR